MKVYSERILDDILKERLCSAGAVVVEGAKWCGKTTTCARQAKSILYMDDPDHRDQYLQMAASEIGILLNGANPRLIDEWQDAPKFWDAIRHRVDHSEGSGKFMLTGSSVLPESKRKEIHHSGTGRYAWLKMRPMTLWESGESSGEVSLRTLFERKAFASSQAQAHTLAETAFIICRGGWPASIGRTGAGALRLARDYHKAVMESDISRYDDVPRDPERVRNLLRSYARLQGTSCSLSSIRQDMLVHDARGLSEDTILSYLRALRGIFVIEDVPAWCPELRAKDSVRTAVTRYFTDPSIAVAALGTTPAGLVNDLRSFGFFFESLAIRDLRVYADSLDGTVRHYHDKTGLECDAVVETWTGDYALIEIKTGGETLISEGAKTLNKLSDLIASKKFAPPAFRMIITATGEFAYRRAEDGIIVCPLSALRN